MAVCEDGVRKPGGSLQASVSLIGSLLALIFSCRFYSYFSQTVREIELSDKDTFVLFFNKVAPSLFPHIPALFFTRWKKDNSILHKNYEQEYQSCGQ